MEVIVKTKEAIQRTSSVVQSVKYTCIYAHPFPVYGIRENFFSDTDF